MKFDVKKDEGSAVLTLHHGIADITVSIHLCTVQNPTFLLYTVLLFLGGLPRQTDMYKFSGLGPGAGFKGKVDMVKK